MLPIQHRRPRLALAPLTALLALASACAPDAPAPVAAEQPIRLVRDPGPPPLEAPPRHTVWRAGADGWTADGRALAISADGRARIDLDHRLRVDGRVAAEHALPPLAVLADGSVVFTAQAQPPERDLWRVKAGAAPTRLTLDGTSDRPIATPDGRLLHIASVNGRARWMLDGSPLVGAEALPPPAYADRHRWDDGVLVYDAGEAQWWLDPATGRGGRR